MIVSPLAGKCAPQTANTTFIEQFYNGLVLKPDKGVVKVCHIFKCWVRFRGTVKHAWSNASFTTSFEHTFKMWLIGLPLLPRLFACELFEETCPWIAPKTRGSTLFYTISSFFTAHHTKMLNFATYILLMKFSMHLHSTSLKFHKLKPKTVKKLQ